MEFNNKVYDVLKYIAQYVLPALGTLYFAIAKIWGLPYGAEVVGTIAAIDTFIGVLMGISSVSYNEDTGEVTVTPSSDAAAELNDDAVEAVKAKSSDDDSEN